MTGRAGNEPGDDQPVTTSTCTGVPLVSTSYTADRLRDAHWNVTEVGNLRLDDVSVTTVFFTPDNEAEQDAAEAIGKLLEAPVHPRIEDPDVAHQPPGVIVVVAG